LHDWWSELLDPNVPERFLRIIGEPQQRDRLD
jgi:hypothetical protein